MLLVIDCKHRLIAKTPQRPLNNGTSKSNRSEKGNKAEKVDLLDEENSTIQIEDPTMPAVSYFSFYRFYFTKSDYPNILSGTRLSFLFNVFIPQLTNKVYLTLSIISCMKYRYHKLQKYTHTHTH